MSIRTALAAFVLFSTSVAHAHPGHGVDGGSWSLVHFLSDPLHVGFAAALLVGLGALAGVRRRRLLRVRSPRG